MLKLNMLILNRNVFLNMMKNSGYRSIGDLARALGVHRNSISNYIRGKGVLQPVVQALIDKIKIDPKIVFMEIKPKSSSINVERLLAPLVDSLVQRFPKYSFILFGSRATKHARLYSDIDLGILSSDSLPIAAWSEIRNIVDQYTEDLPYLVDVVDLGRADPEFLNAARRDAVFLGGSLTGWAEFIQ